MGWQWHQLDHMQIICTSLQTDNHASTEPLSFYRPDGLSATQPTASQHWRHLVAYTQYRYIWYAYILYVYIGWSDVRVVYDLHAVGQHCVLCEVKWRRFDTSFEWRLRKGADGHCHVTLTLDQVKVSMHHTIYGRNHSLQLIPFVTNCLLQKAILHPLHWIFNVRSHIRLLLLPFNDRLLQLNLV